MTDAPQATGERRKSPRIRTILSATLREQSRATTWSCVVRNMSSDGARLEIANSTWVPDRFEFDVVNKDVRRHAKVVWREQSQLGISFNTGDEAQQRSANDELKSLRVRQELLRQRITELTG